ncbi:hypothetical protein FRC17_005071 [Serendipita sp. 399]|nr:hypothetical protein FRC17_005071 [Serendipita sp. 399]
MTSKARAIEVSEDDTEDEIDTLSRQLQKRKRHSDIPDSSRVKTVATAQGKPGSLEWMLSSDKSPLCTSNLKRQKVINEDTWICLPEEDRKALSSLLTPTIHPNFEPTLPWYHPSRRPVDADAQVIPEEEGQLETTDEFEATTSLFMNLPSLEAALVTFQDHLYSGWFTSKHKKEVKKFSDGIMSGDLHAAWKDEAWEQEQRQEDEGRSRRADRPNLAKMHHLDIILTGDVLSYRRHFPELGIDVEKDILVEGRWAHGLSVMAPGGQESYLPLGMLISEPILPPPPGASVQQMHIQSPEELEEAVLDIDGRIPRENRRKVDSWKRFSMWRRLSESQSGRSSWDGLDSMGVRGPREKRGTLFYLRGAF